MRTKWLPHILLALVVLVLFGDVVSYPYVWDDFLLIEMGVGEALQIPPERVHVRPVWYLSHVVTSSVVREPWFDHLVNLLLFVASALLAYGYAQPVAGTRRAAVAVLLWVIAPWNVYPVAWVAQRNDLLIYLFVLSALLALRARRFGAAAVATGLALFSKITAAFFPLYVAWKMRVAGKQRLALAMLVVFIAYLALAIDSYLRVQELGAHLVEAPVVVRMLRFPVHWVEHMFLLAVPIPFFTGWLHAGVYGVFLAAAIAVARIARDRCTDQQGLEILSIALLLSIPTIVTPHLRICGLESFFWILLLARSVSFKTHAVGAVALAALVISSLWGGIATKEIFRTHAQRAGTAQRVGLYPNDYYEQRDEVVRDFARRLLGR